MQQKKSLHWIANMYLIFASLVALQLLSSTTSRSIHTDNGDKMSTGNIAKLLLPLLNSENVKDDFKVRVVPYKDYSKEGKEKRKINHAVATPKRKVKKDLPVAIIIAEQGHKHQNKKLKSKGKLVHKRYNDNSANSHENSFVDNSDVDVSNSLEDNGKAHPKIHGYSLKSLKSLIGKLLKNVKRKTLHNKANHIKHKDKNVTDEDKSITNEDKSDTAEDSSVTDEDNSVADESDSLTVENNSGTGENNSVTDKNNSVTVENDSVTDENNSVTDENNSVTVENKSITDEDNSKSNDVVTIESDSQNEESNSSQSSVTSEEHSDSGDKDSDNISNSKSAQDETENEIENTTDFLIENSSSASDSSTSSVENKIKNKQKLESSESASDDDDNMKNSHDSSSESKSDNSYNKKEDIAEENFTHETDYDVLNEEILDALLNGGLEKGIYAPSVEFENDDIVDKSISDESKMNDSAKGLKYMPVEQLSKEANVDTDRQLHYIYKPPYHPYGDYGSNNNNNDDASVSNEENKHQNHKPKHKKHVVPNTDVSNEKSVESNEENSSDTSNDGKKNAKRKKFLKEKNDVKKEVKKFEKQVKCKLHDIINKLKRSDDTGKIGKKINITFNFSTQIIDETTPDKV